MRPSVVLIDTKGKAHQIREKETLEYLEEKEKMPEYLKKFSL
jgi:transposase